MLSSVVRLHRIKDDGSLTVKILKAAMDMKVIEYHIYNSATSPEESPFYSFFSNVLNETLVMNEEIETEENEKKALKSKKKSNNNHHHRNTIEEDYAAQSHLLGKRDRDDEDEDEDENGGRGSWNDQKKLKRRKGKGDDELGVTGDGLGGHG